MLDHGVSRRRPVARARGGGRQAGGRGGAERAQGGGGDPVVRSRRGRKVLAEAKEIGWITSAVRSIALGQPIALGYLRREHFAPGAAVTIQDDGTSIPARVAELPFVTR
ncbi:MAG: hypothetical protein DMD86_12510 [Candidatus Rokuibacteriota bacterium]|nr:MAG: hypothetical protein DMD86_12510 [Candidatus Rokubacteria bacterium]